MKKSWTLADVLDLEFFLSSDQELIDGGGDEHLAERDREIYLQIRELCGRKDSAETRACLLRHWLSRRRQQFRHESGGTTVLPGGLYQELTRICGWFIFVLALFLGWGGAFSFLSYSGKTPVNVSFYFLFFVCSQLVLLMTLLISFFARHLIGGDSLPIIYTFLRKGVLHLAGKIGRLPAAMDTHRWLAGLSGRLRRRHRSYGLLFVLPFFLMIQLGGIGFNLGVLAATLLKVVGTDIAFGWQSTLQLGSETVYRLVRAIASPWSRFLPAGVGYPDPDQIRGSQMVLKDGIYHLTTGNLVSWWPFLCLSVAVYGLLPRVCLLLAGWWSSRSLLRRLDFATADQHQLLHRMLTPRLSTESDREELPVQEKGEDKPVEEDVVPPAGGRVLALIPDELFDDCGQEELAELVRDRLGQRLERCLRINHEAEDEDVFQEIQRENLTETDALLLLQEAWQPPIEELFFFLRSLRELVGEKVLLSIVFIGKPNSETIFTPPAQQDYQIWRKKIETLGDPYMHCVRLVNA
ncbi:MAG TPA: DUF2868 domain-containing protein [Desulfobulbus sp.]|nr:DUF2868 domain-containing protein [Desulfobulbus sp.]